MASLDGVDTVDDSVDERRHGEILLVIDRVLLPTVAVGPETSAGGRGGIRTHGGPKDLNGFRGRPIRPLWHPSGTAR
jgi:hypothetical protein